MKLYLKQKALITLGLLSLSLACSKPDILESSPTPIVTEPTQTLRSTSIVLELRTASGEAQDISESSEVQLTDESELVIRIEGIIGLSDEEGGSDHHPENRRLLRDHIVGDIQIEFSGEGEGALSLKSQSGLTSIYDIVDVGILNITSSIDICPEAAPCPQPIEHNPITILPSLSIAPATPASEDDNGIMQEGSTKTFNIDLVPSILLEHVTIASSGDLTIAYTQGGENFTATALDVDHNDRVTRTITATLPARKGINAQNATTDVRIQGHYLPAPEGLVLKINGVEVNDDSVAYNVNDPLFDASFTVELLGTSTVSDSNIDQSSVVFSEYPEQESGPIVCTSRTTNPGNEILDCNRVGENRGGQVNFAGTTGSTRRQLRMTITAPPTSETLTYSNEGTSSASAVQGDYQYDQDTAPTRRLSFRLELNNANTEDQYVDFTNATLQTISPITEAHRNCTNGSSIPATPNPIAARCSAATALPNTKVVSCPIDPNATGTFYLRTSLDNSGSCTIYQLNVNGTPKLELKSAVDMPTYYSGNIINPEDLVTPEHLRPGTLLRVVDGANEQITVAESRLNHATIKIEAYTTPGSAAITLPDPVEIMTLRVREIDDAPLQLRIAPSVVFPQCAADSSAQEITVYIDEVEHAIRSEVNCSSDRRIGIEIAPASINPDEKYELELKGESAELIATSVTYRPEFELNVLKSGFSLHTEDMDDYLNDLLASDTNPRNSCVAIFGVSLARFKPGHLGSSQEAVRTLSNELYTLCNALHADDVAPPTGWPAANYNTLMADLSALTYKSLDAGGHTNNDPITDAEKFFHAQYEKYRTDISRAIPLGPYASFLANIDPQLDLLEDSTNAVCDKTNAPFSLNQVATQAMRIKRYITDKDHIDTARLRNAGAAADALINAWEQKWTESEGYLNQVIGTDILCHERIHVQSLIMTQNQYDTKFKDALNEVYTDLGTEATNGFWQVQTSQGNPCNDAAPSCPLSRIQFGSDGPSPGDHDIGLSYGKMMTEPEGRRFFNLREALGIVASLTLFSNQSRCGNNDSCNSDDVRGTRYCGSGTEQIADSTESSGSLQWKAFYFDFSGFSKRAHPSSGHQAYEYQLLIDVFDWKHQADKMWLNEGKTIEEIRNALLISPHQPASEWYFQTPSEALETENVCVAGLNTWFRVRGAQLAPALQTMNFINDDDFLEGSLVSAFELLRLDPGRLSPPAN